MQNRWLIILVPATALLGGCSRLSPGTGLNPDAAVQHDAAVQLDAAPQHDAAPPPDGGQPGCEPQVVYEDPDIDCDGCSYCADPQPYRWNGSRCVFEPICCACAGPDCFNRSRTWAECDVVYQGCPHDLLEVEYPAARLIWQAPGGFAGSGPILMLGGHGWLRSWNQSFSTQDWDHPDPDYVETLGVEEANAIFSLLAAVDYDLLPHPPTVSHDCYPSLRLSWSDNGTPEQLNYVAGQDLRPEFDAIYEWLGLRLCRGQSIAGYPFVLPHQYCFGF